MLKLLGLLHIVAGGASLESLPLKTDPEWDAFTDLVAKKIGTTVSYALRRCVRCGAIVGSPARWVGCAHLFVCLFVASIN